MGSADVDFTHHATTASLCQHFLEAAWDHAEALGVGFAPLAAQGRFWVLSRLRVEVREYPRWGASVTLRTWPRPAQSVFALRDFEIVNDADQRVAAGSSAWLVLDSISKRPQRLGTLLPHLAHLRDRPALDRNPEKLTEDGPWAEAFSTSVRYTDIDVNSHVSSGRYLRWILDAYPNRFYLEHSLRGLDVNYVDEVHEGDLLRVRLWEKTPTIHYHSLVRGGDHEVCRARLEWCEMAAPGGPPAGSLSNPGEARLRPMKHAVQRNRGGQRGSLPPRLANIESSTGGGEAWDRTGQCLTC